MTSSKSLRATLLPSLSFRSHSQNGPELKSKPESDSSARKALRDNGQPPADGPQKILEPIVEGSSDPGPPSTRPRAKSKTKPWSTRISSLIPSLTIQTTDPRPMSIQRKPITGMAPPSQPPPPPPPAAPPVASLDPPANSIHYSPAESIHYSPAGSFDAPPAPFDPPPPPPSGPPPPPPQPPLYSVAESTSSSSLTGDSPTLFESDHQHSDTSSFPPPQHSPPTPPKTEVYYPASETPAVASQISLLVMPQSDVISPLDEADVTPQIMDPTPPSPSVYSATNTNTPVVDRDIPVPALPIIDFDSEIDTQLRVNPVIMDPTPPSPRPERSSFGVIDENVGLSRNSAENSEDSFRQDLPPNGNGNVEINVSRQRSISFSERKDSLTPMQGLRTRQTAPLPEPRGRSVSARVNSTLIDGSRLSTSTNLRPVSGISQSPTRRKLRRSWMPGRSRSNSMDANHGHNLAAWVISEDNKTEYNPTFLKTGEKV